MKKTKRILVPLLTALLVAGLIGCANGKKENNNDNMNMDDKKMENMDNMNGKNGNK